MPICKDRIGGSVVAEMQVVRMKGINGRGAYRPHELGRSQGGLIRCISEKNRLRGTAYVRFLRGSIRGANIVPIIAIGGGNGFPIRASEDLPVSEVGIDKPPAYIPERAIFVIIDAPKITPLGGVIGVGRESPIPILGVHSESDPQLFYIAQASVLSSLLPCSRKNRE